MLYIVSLSKIPSAAPIPIFPTSMPSINMPSSHQSENSKPTPSMTVITSKPTTDPIENISVLINVDNNTSSAANSYIVVSSIIVVAVIIALFVSLICWYTTTQQSVVAVNIEEKSQNASNQIDRREKIGNMHPTEVTIEEIPKLGTINPAWQIAANNFEDGNNNKGSIEDLFGPGPGPSTKGTVKYTIEDSWSNSLSDKIHIELDTTQTKENSNVGESALQVIDTLKDDAITVVVGDV